MSVIRNCLLGGLFAALTGSATAQAQSGRDEDPSSARPLNSAKTGRFFENQGARIHRLNDRVLIGDATVGDAAYPNVTKDWLSAFLYGIGFPNGAPVTSQLVVLNSGQPNAGIAGTFGAHSLRSVNPATGFEALGDYCVADSPIYGSPCYAGYDDVTKASKAATGGNVGREIDARALFSTNDPDPFTNPDTWDLQLAAGGQAPSTGQFPISEYVQLIGNGSTAYKGIVVRSGSLTANSAGLYEALDLPKNHGVFWYGAAGRPTDTIVSTTTQPSNGLTMAFSDSGLTVKNHAGGSVLTASANGVVAAERSVQIRDSYAVATLPRCDSAAFNSWAVVNDAAGPISYRGAVTQGGGVEHVPVWCGPSGWEYH